MIGEFINAIKRLKFPHFELQTIVTFHDVVIEQFSKVPLAPEIQDMTCAELVNILNAEKTSWACLPLLNLIAKKMESENNVPIPILMKCLSKLTSFESQTVRKAKPVLVQIE